ncbi:MAG: hypothetical protein L0H23_00640 [Luteimonas sp.]|nr:hypothetical protein [Luteimonas sp.]
MLESMNTTNALHDTVDALCEAQDAATMQIVAIAKLARQALDSEADDAVDQVGHAIDAIMQLAAAANAQLDRDQIAISDARLYAARAAAPSPFGRVESVGVR